jgi:hypothetical protein
MSNLRFELWWAGGTTTLLTTQPQVGSLPRFAHPSPYPKQYVYTYCHMVFPRQLDVLSPLTISRARLHFPIEVASYHLSSLAATAALSLVGGSIRLAFGFIIYLIEACVLIAGAVAIGIGAYCP